MLVTTGALLLVLRPWLDGATRFAAAGPYAPAASTLTLLGMGTLSVLGASFAIDVSGFRSAPLLPDAPPRWFYLASLAVLVVTSMAPIFGAAGVHAITRGLRSRRLTQGAWGATALLVLVALTSGREEFDSTRYVDTLPRIATLPGVQSLPREGEAGYAARFDDLLLYATCAREGHRLCNLLVGSQTIGSDREGYAGLLVERHEALDLRRDRARSLVLARRQNGTITACSAQDGRRVDLSSAAFPEHAGPPRPWTVGALLGLVVAGALLLRRRVHSDEWTPATALAGRLRFDDGRVLRVVPPLEFKGPALIRGVLRDEDPYRDTADIEGAQVLPGSPDDLRRAAHAAKVTRELMALATLVLTSAPLWTAAARGLVFR